jgi:4-cresol dehydrogenase (hydroxylating)
MSRVLPPNVAERDFDRALRAFAAVVGPEWLFTSDEDRQSYLDPMAIGDPREHEPSGALAPQSVEEIQGILAIANRYRIPLWPVSMGKNFAYGTAAPRMQGTMVLDLKRLNRVLEVNEELACALVEPGVSFFDFHRRLADTKLWMSGPAHSWGSVIGNALEHGVGYTVYGVHAEAICGMEVVLANGEIVRTGMGAVAGSREWQAYKQGYGPVWDGAFTQSNFGIVTKMGIWLMPEPEGMAGVTISLAREEDLEALVDTLRPLRLDDTINSTYTIMNGVRQVFRVGARSRLYQGSGHLPREVIAEQLQKQGDGWWSVIFNLFDRPAGLDVRLRAIEEAFARIPGARLTTQRWRRGEPLAPWMRQDVSLAPLGVIDWHGSPGGHTDFGPVVAPVGARVREVYDLVYRRFEEFGIDCFVGMFGVGSRAIVMVADLIYNRSDADMTQRARALFRTLTQDAARIGVGIYRAHLNFMDDGAAMYGYNDHALRRFAERVKDCLDPNGILAPGKQGIWPRSLRAPRRGGGA